MNESNNNYWIQQPLLLSLDYLSFIFTLWLILFFPCNLPNETTNCTYIKSWPILYNTVICTYLQYKCKKLQNNSLTTFTDQVRGHCGCRWVASPKQCWLCQDPLIVCQEWWTTVWNRALKACGWKRCAQSYGGLHWTWCGFWLFWEREMSWWKEIILLWVSPVWTRVWRNIGTGVLRELACPWRNQIWSSWLFENTFGDESNQNLLRAHKRFLELRN